MAGLNVTASPLIDSTQPHPPSVGIAVARIEAAGQYDIAAALKNLQASVDSIHNALRQTSPAVTDIRAYNSSGEVVARIGAFPTVAGETRYGGWFQQLFVGYVGDSDDPIDAPFFTDSSGNVKIGASGSIDVLDAWSASAAWLGIQYDVIAVTNAVDNGSGLIRITTGAAHNLSTGNSVQVLNVGGVPNARGTFTVTVIGATTLDLQASVFSGAYTSGGTIQRILSITNAANNGSGLIRITTSVSHTYETGDRVSIAGVGGVTNANGRWTITAIGATTFDLQASTFAGAYTSGGTSLRFFAGGLFQTIAVGGSDFINYKLRAYADGSLQIKDALITLTGTGATIVLDPSDGSITVTGATHRTKISDGFITIETAAGAAPRTVINSSRMVLSDSSNVSNVEFEGNAAVSRVSRNTATYTTEPVFAARGFMSASGVTPVIQLTNARGTIASPSQILSGDPLGGIVASGYSSTGDYFHAAAMRVLASENFTGTAAGSAIVFETTPLGSTSKAERMRIRYDGNVGIATTSPGYALDVTGDINASSAYRIGGVAGITGNVNEVNTGSGANGLTLTTTSFSYGSSLNVGTTNLQYLDHASAPQTQTVVTSVSLNTTASGTLLSNVTLATTARAFTGGIRTS